MDRRSYLKHFAATATVVMAGCSGGSSPPPRDANVYERVAAADGDIVVDLSAQPSVESRASLSSSQSLDAAVALPVGRAAAAKGGGRGSGATGRGSGGWSSAPKNSNGRAIYHGHSDDDEWREEHDDEIRRYRAVPAVVGAAYLGPESEYSDDPPEPGPVEWDVRRTDPAAGETVEVPIQRPGWYRVGTRLEAAEADHDFGWESIDFRARQTSDSYELTEKWQVPPRL